MGVVCVAVAVLSFLSAAQSAPVTDCDSLIQTVQIQGIEQLLGKWIYIAESTSITGSKQITSLLVDNAWVKMTAANESDAIDSYHAQKMFGKCFAVRTKMTVQNNTISMAKPLLGSAQVLKSGCADCLVVLSKNTVFGRAHSGLQLLSKRTNVSTAELQEFMKQIECLNLPPPAVLSADKGLCPGESSSQETIDVTSDMENLDSQVAELTETIESAVKAFADLFTSA